MAFTDRLVFRYRQKRNWSAKEALENALKYGDGGWCTLDNLEQLIEGKGSLLEMAMHDCGFRPHKKIFGKWVRITPKYENEISERVKDSYKKREEERWTSINGIELERLNQLWVLPNGWAGLNRTYRIQVNNEGLIYVYLELNPFSATRTEQLGWFGEMLRNRGHIAKQQNGFYIDAKNVKLGEQKGVYIKSIRSDESYAECVWPIQTPQEKIYDLADDLISRVTSSNKADVSIAKI